jgi:hypothetical protein
MQHQILINSYNLIWLFLLKWNEKDIDLKKRDYSILAILQKIIIRQWK